MYKKLILKIFCLVVLVAVVLCSCANENEIEQNIWKNTEYNSDSADIILEYENIEELKNYTDDLDFFENPRSIMIALSGLHNGEIFNFDFPKQCTSLEKLTLSNLNSLDCLRIFDKSALKELHINSFDFVDFSNAKINQIYLSQCKNISWETLKNVSELEYLYISNSDSLPNFEILSDMDEIKTVWLEYSSDEWESMGISSEKISAELNPESGKLTLTDTVPDWFNVEFCDSFLSESSREIIIRISP